MVFPRRSGTVSVAALASLALVAAGGVSALLLPASPAAALNCSNGYVALTFDDGPTSMTPALVNTLRSAGARATMFNVGQKAKQNPSLVQTERSAGMWIGNHSYTHPYLTSLSAAQVTSELSQTNSAITAAGAGRPTLLRPPYGATNSTVSSAASGQGLRTVTWTVDSQDWNGAGTSAIVAAANNLRAGGIMLMHDGYQSTINAIPQIVTDLSNRGLCPGMISSATGTAVAPDGGSGGTGGSTTTNPTTGSGGGTCTAGYTRTGTWSDRFNGQVTVSGTTTWTVTVTLSGSQRISSTWNASTSWPSATVMTAKPNGSGNSFGFTVMANGTWTTPQVSCRVG